MYIYIFDNKETILFFHVYKNIDRNITIQKYLSRVFNARITIKEMQNICSAYKSSAIFYKFINFLFFFLREMFFKFGNSSA